jgi:hypothetical protein
VNACGSSSAAFPAWARRRSPDLLETLGWLKAAEKSFDFWDNPADAVYDAL